MVSRLAWYCRAKRQAQGLSVEDLALRMGHRNVRKCVRRIVRLERDGNAPDMFLTDLVDALSIEYQIILDLIERDIVRNSTTLFHNEV